MMILGTVAGVLFLPTFPMARDRLYALFTQGVLNQVGTERPHGPQAELQRD